jgi:hypothetical protein
MKYSADSTDVDTIFEDSGFIEWWKSENGKTQLLDYMDVAVITVAYKAYHHALYVCKDSVQMHACPIESIMTKEPAYTVGYYDALHTVVKLLEEQT